MNTFMNHCFNILVSPSIGTDGPGHTTFCQRLLAIVASLALLLGPTAFTPRAFAAPSCQYILGFGVLHDALSDRVGDCVDNQTFNVFGDATQDTTHGLLVWRKADNSTAFTDGAHTWVNGPYGISARLNSQRFGWESDAGVGGAIVVDPNQPAESRPPAPVIGTRVGLPAPIYSPANWLLGAAEVGPDCQDAPYHTASYATDTVTCLTQAVRLFEGITTGPTASTLGDAMGNEDLAGLFSPGGTAQYGYLCSSYGMSFTGITDHRSYCHFDFLTGPFGQGFTAGYFAAAAKGSYVVALRMVGGTSLTLNTWASRPMDLAAYDALNTVKRSTLVARLDTMLSRIPG